MEVRDGAETDADALAALADLPVGAVEQLLHERTVRIGVCDGTDPDSLIDPGDVEGFVAFGARPGTVHVTQIEGGADAVTRLLEEPVRFARAEGMSVEMVVPAGTPVCDAIESFGFETVGDGPSFEGAPTRRYRLDTPDGNR